VERQLAIIGEAVRHLQRLDPSLALNDAKDIVGMRNRLIHSYDNVDDKLVWQVVRLDLAPLESCCFGQFAAIGRSVSFMHHVAARCRV
jgi:uncharacterized protein with HEPN domain